MTFEREASERETGARVQPAGRRGPARPGAVSSGSVICLFDGSPRSVPRLRLGAEAAIAGGCRLVVAHTESRTTGFWAAAFTGYGACLGPPEEFYSSQVEAAFSTAVVALLDLDTAWDFVSASTGHQAAVRRLVAEHAARVIVVEQRGRFRRRLLLRRLAHDATLTVLTLA